MNNKARSENMEGEKINFCLVKIAKEVNPKAKELLDMYISKENRDLVNYQLETGGKKLRPTLAVVSCLLCGGRIKDAIYPAAGLEILHNYSLIIDDLIDDSKFRRKKETLWANFGTSIAQCVGSSYATAIFQSAGRSKNSKEIVDVLARTIKTLADGEILDILFEFRGRENEPFITENRYKKVTEKDYFEMISKKTAVLFEACCEIGGLCAGATKSQIEHLKRAGFYLGMAGQIQDDILDIFGQEEKTGKQVGKDIYQRKRGNIVILYTMEALSSSEKKKLCMIMKKGVIINKDINTAMSLINKTNSCQRSLKIAKRYIEKAKKELSYLPHNKWNALLGQIADFIVERDR